MNLELIVSNAYQLKNCTKTQKKINIIQAMQRKFITPKLEVLDFNLLAKNIKDTSNIKNIGTPKK